MEHEHPKHLHEEPCAHKEPDHREIMHKLEEMHRMLREIENRT